MWTRNRTGGLRHPTVRSSGTAATGRSGSALTTVVVLAVDTMRRRTRGTLTGWATTGKAESTPGSRRADQADSRSRCAGFVLPESEGPGAVDPSALWGSARPGASASAPVTSCVPAVPRSSWVAVVRASLTTAIRGRFLGISPLRGFSGSARSWARPRGSHRGPRRAGRPRRALHRSHAGRRPLQRRPRRSARDPHRPVRHPLRRGRGPPRPDRPGAQAPPGRARPRRTPMP